MLEIDMASGDVTVVRRLFEAHERGDGAAFLSLCHPRVEYRGRTSDARVFHGRDGMRRWLGELRATDVEIDAVPQDYDDRGDHVVVVGRLRIWDDGALKDSEATWCFEVEDGLVTKIVPFDDRLP